MDYPAFLHEAAARKLLQPPFTVSLLTGNEDRRPGLKRIHLQVTDASGQNLKVTIGCTLGEARRQADEFYGALRAHSARTVFFFTMGDADVWAQEWISGSSLEDHPLVNGRNVADTILALETLDRALEATAVDSSWEAWDRELDEFCATVRRLPLWDEKEVESLEQLLSSLGRQLRPREKPRCRWSNGDFFSANVRLTETGHPVLLDFEYGRRTHFFTEDHVRFSQLSRMAIEQPAIFAGLWPETNAAWEVFFNLRQLVLETAVNTSEYLSRAVPLRKARLQVAAESLAAQSPGRSTPSKRPEPAYPEETVQLFWESAGGWNETRSQRLQIRRGIPQFVAFRLPANARHVRLDPAASTRAIDVKSIYSLEANRSLASLVPHVTAMGAEAAIRGDGLTLLPHGPDPQLLIQLPPSSAFLIAELLVSATPID